jgi:hypothetical protein
LVLEVLRAGIVSHGRPEEILTDKASKNWRLLNGSSLLPDVIAGAIYLDGVKENAA